jgi:hypothetical protein
MSGIEPCHICQQIGGNFNIQNLLDFFPNRFGLTHAIIDIQSDMETHRIICLFDKWKHNKETDCPYLFLVFHSEYHLTDFTLDDMRLAAEAYKQ